MASKKSDDVVADDAASVAGINISGLRLADDWAKKLGPAFQQVMAFVDKAQPVVAQAYTTVSDAYAKIPADWMPVIIGACGRIRALCCERVGVVPSLACWLPRANICNMLSPFLHVYLVGFCIPPGLLLCFYGGTFCLTIAAVQAFYMCGYENTKKCFLDLAEEWKVHTFFPMACESLSKSSGKYLSLPVSLASPHPFLSPSPPSSPRTRPTLSSRPRAAAPAARRHRPREPRRHRPS
jgi:hypothetical protein